MKDTDYKVACFGEILWDVLPGGAVPGGAPMNVAYHLHQLGEKPVLITRVGEDEKGEALKKILREKGVGTDLLQTDETQATGIVYGTADANGDMKYEIVKPSAWDFIEADEPAKAAVSSARYFVFGSLAARDRVTRNSLLALLDVAETKVLDVNLRPPFYNEELIPQLVQKADIVKLNNDELELLAGWWQLGDGLKTRTEGLQRRSGAHTIIVTRGAAGAAVLYDGRLYEYPGYKVKVADTVGSGDAFLAGFLHQRINGADIDKALNFACRLGAFVASRSGAWPDYSLKEIDTLTNL